MKRLLSILLTILAIASTAWADDGKWDFNPYDFQYDMSAYVNLNVDGCAADISRYAVAAFCGEQCRGIVEAKRSGETQYGYLRIRSNQESGEQITFKVYDNEAGCYLKSDNSLTFASQEVVGLPGTPFEIAAANKYNVVFLIDGEVYRSNEVYYGENIPVVDAPEKEGHTFAQWVGIPETMPAHDVTITGSYTINLYTVTYMTDDGEVVRVDVVEYGASLPEAPEAPAREGYDFKGWGVVPEKMPAENITIVGEYGVTTNIHNILIEGEQVVAYDLRGNIIKKDAKSLPTGVYIINGQKVMIKRN